MNEQSTDHTSAADIALIGMAGRFPGAGSIDKFWLNLRDGVNSTTFFTDEELISAGVNPDMMNDPHYVRAGAVLDDVELFDASFFGFTPREAELTDPQHRFFLECAWEAIEHAGYYGETFEGRIGVYAGASLNRYLLNIYLNRQVRESAAGLQLLIGNRTDHLPTRVSYKLNLKGPSINIQSACSTSLVAVSVACHGLLDYQCDMALAGGVSIHLPQKSGYVYEAGGILSPDGYCRAFDAQAAGTVGGSGVGIVVLKRLAEALADGDYIHAVIKGTAINNDGSLKVGYTAPSVEGQCEVVAEALAMARIDPATVGYVETHGTATPLGDSIEFAALTKAYRARTGKRNFCAIGSVKTNIGHLDAAAGVAGLIKTALALKHKQLPPSLHYEQPNPALEMAQSPFVVNTKLTAWETADAPRRAGVSSFGIGGTNAHVVLEESPSQTASGESRPRHLLVLSARTESALDAATGNLLTHLKDHPEENLADVAYTLQVGRKAFSHRRLVLCDGSSDAVSALESPPATRVRTNIAEDRERPVVMMFPGQGTQYVRMAAELYQREKTFRELVEVSAKLLKPHLRLDLTDILYPAADQAASLSPQLEQTSLAQPALFVVEYALARLWMEWGVHPEAMIGHSIGEYVAACLAGVMSLEDALFLVAMRGRLVQQLPHGKMLALQLAEKDVRALLETNERLALAALNSPSLCVVSGPADAVNQLANWCEKNEILASALHTSHAFHSHMMEPILGEFAAQVSTVALHPPRIPFVSNVTGEWITAKQATDPVYWASHLRQAVRFAEGVVELLKRPERIWLEVGPGQALSAAVRETAGGAPETLALSSIKHPHEERSDLEFILGTLGQLWLAGVKIDWARFHAHERRRRVPLPTYPFERQRYWVEAGEPSADYQALPEASEEAPGVSDWFYVPVWKQAPMIDTLAGRTGATEEKMCWLMFMDDCGLGPQLATLLEEQGQDVVRVFAGDEFTHVADALYTVNPQRYDDYDKLLSSLNDLNKTPARVVHLWTVLPDAQDVAKLESVEAKLLHSFFSLLSLAQALGIHAAGSCCRIEIVSNNLYDVTGEEMICPARATILGPVLVIPQEFPNITCRNLDVLVPVAGEETARRRLAAQLIGEFFGPASDAIVAYRGGHRWTQVVERLRLDERDSRLREGGRYLITGGLSAFGLACAKYLAQTVHARLVLLVADYFPERYEWQQWLASHDEKDEVSRKIHEVYALEEQGAEVMVKAGDMTSQEQMQLIVAQARQRFGEFNGVIHAAESPDNSSLIRLRTAAEAVRLVEARVKAASTLNAVLNGTPLDFLILFSSASSLTNTLGQVEACAGNAFLDAYAHYDGMVNDRFTTTIDWGLRQWEVLGDSSLSGLPEAQAELRRRQDSHGLTLQDGVAALSRVLSHRLPQVIVSKGDYRLLSEQQQTFTRSIDVNQLGPARPSSSSSVAAEVGAAEAPGNQTEQTIALIWQEILGIERVGRHDDFFELGGNSLVGIQLVSRLRRTFMLDLPMSSLFASPTVAALAAHISESLLEKEDAEELEHMIAEIENLSPIDLDARIADAMRPITEVNRNERLGEKI